MAGYPHTALLLLLIGIVAAQDVDPLDCDVLCPALCTEYPNERDFCLQFCNTHCSDSLERISAIDKMVDSSTDLTRRDIDLALRGDEVRHRDKRFIGQLFMNSLQFQSQLIKYFWDLVVSLFKWPNDIGNNLLQDMGGFWGFDGKPQDGGTNYEPSVENDSGIGGGEASESGTPADNAASDLNTLINDAISSTEEQTNMGGGAQDVLDDLLDAEKQPNEGTDEQDVEAMINQAIQDTWTGDDEDTDEQDVEAMINQAVEDTWTGDGEDTDEQDVEAMINQAIEDTWTGDNQILAPSKQLGGDKDEVTTAKTEEKEKKPSALSRLLAKVIGGKKKNSGKKKKKKWLG